MPSTIPTTIEVLYARSLDALCCQNPVPAVAIEQRIFSTKHHIFCENCRSELKPKLFLSPA